MRTLLALAAASLLAAPLEAQGWIEPLPGHWANGVVKIRTAVSVRVDGRIALVEVEEWFQNRGRGLGEGDYLYPLPGEAVFSNFSLFQGDEELRGETMDARKARAIYEDIVRRKKDPALIELVGHGLIRARVFPISAGETRKITLRYTQVMNRTGDALQFQYAAGGVTGPTPRTIEGFRGPRHQIDRTPIAFRLVADSGGNFRDPFSPTHQVRVSRDEDGRLTVRPAGDLAGDFVLFLPFARDMVGITVATHKPSGEEGYFMLTLSPGEVRGSTLPRDVTAVVDISGSMSGEKLEQAKAALRQLLSSLGQGDRFRLIAFSSRVTAHRTEWTRATSDAIRDAREWVDRLAANGGTNIEGALAEAFRLESRTGRLPIVIFLTDGLPSVGEDNPERLAAQAERARAEARVFAFGVGYDVNTYLLDRLSYAGRGTTQYVRPGEDVEEAVGHLVAKVQHPVLADLELADAPVELTEVYPQRLPDLFAGEELVVFGRYRAARRTRSGDVVLTGQRNNRTEGFRARVQFPDHTPGNDFIPRLWASRKIGYLSQAVRLNGPNEELEQEIRETALRYGLLSEYTSYLVQEPMEISVSGFQNVLPRWDSADRGRLALADAKQAPSSQAVGPLAVNIAEQARVRREVRSEIDLAAADMELVDRLHGPNTRHVAGRLFIEKDSIWTDLRHSDSLEVIEIEPFSEAYFELLGRAPELRAYFSAFRQVLVAGDKVSIQVSSGGAEHLSPLKLSRLVTDFRGR